MIRFIFLSIAFMIISFFAVPIYFGISKEHQKLTRTTALKQNDPSITFQEIYELADKNYISDPSALNSITPAADGKTKAENGFSRKEDRALPDIQTDMQNDNSL